MKKLHPTQVKLLEIFKSNVDYSLTIREMQDILNLSSTSVVHHHILQLEKKGLLRRDNDNFTNYKIVSDDNSELTYLDLYGLVECGPNGRIVDSNPLDRIPVSNKMFNFDLSECFLVKANGDSMEPKIYNGDIVLAKRSNFIESGKIAICVNNEKALIKKVKQVDDEIHLLSLNKRYSHIVADRENFFVEGIVKSVLTNAI